MTHEHYGGYWGRKMKTYRGHLIAVAVVTAWAVFGYAYLGVEDGSSGLSPLGWLHAIFFLPGGFVMQQLKGAHSNADLPLMAGIGWLAYSLLAIALVQLVRMARGPRKAGPTR